MEVTETVEDQRVPDTPASPAESPSPADSDAPAEAEAPAEASAPAAAEAAKSEGDDADAADLPQRRKSVGCVASCAAKVVTGHRLISCRHRRLAATGPLKAPARWPML